MVSSTPAPPADDAEVMPPADQPLEQARWALESHHAIAEEATRAFPTPAAEQLGISNGAYQRLAAAQRAALEQAQTAATVAIAERLDRIAAATEKIAAVMERASLTMPNPADRA